MAGPLFAHDGPPFPVIMDEPVPGYLVSVWADPDIGTGTFYVMTQPTQDSAPQQDPPKIELWVQPENGRLPKSNYLARQQELRNRLQFIAEPVFDRQEVFSVGIVIENTDGRRTELLTEVEATPPGLGPWDLAIYLFPFVMFGGLWVIGFFKRSRSPINPHATKNQEESSNGSIIDTSNSRSDLTP